MGVIDAAVRVINYVRARAKKSPALLITDQRNGRVHVGLLFNTNFDGRRGSNAPLGCMNSNFALVYQVGICLEITTYIFLRNNNYIFHRF